VGDGGILKKKQFQDSPQVLSRERGGNGEAPSTRLVAGRGRPGGPKVETMQSAKLTHRVGGGGEKKKNRSGTEEEQSSSCELGGRDRTEDHAITDDPRSKKRVSTGGVPQGSRREGGRFEGSQNYKARSINMRRPLGGRENEQPNPTVHWHYRRTD